MSTLAPIVLFVYNRPQHTKDTIEALKKNTLASESEIFIYSDAAKNEVALQKVREVREIIFNVTGFKKVSIIEQKNNVGLANSIINGVSKVVNQYGKVIVLEDDLVTSPFFLAFMNKALDFYAEKKSVWHISGWNYPIATDGLGDTFLWRTMNCWGWATWSDRWQNFEKNTDDLIHQFTKDDIYKFNLNGIENFWEQVLANKAGKINTWAIYWYASIFKNKGLCLNPSITYVDNIGLDGTGEHCGANDSYQVNLSNKSYVNLNSELKENIVAFSAIQSFYKRLKKPFLVKLINKISRIIIKKNIFK